MFEPVVATTLDATGRRSPIGSLGCELEDRLASVERALRRTARQRMLVGVVAELGADVQEARWQREQAARLP
jgi:hypothetical protein